MVAAIRKTIVAYIIDSHIKLFFFGGKPQFYRDEALITVICADFKYVYFRREGDIGVHKKSCWYFYENYKETETVSFF